MTVLTSSCQLQIPYNLALIPTVFFPISVAYALLKYSLFDLGNALRVGLSRIGLVTLVGRDLRSRRISRGAVDRRLRQDPLVPMFFSVLVVAAVQSACCVGLEGVVDRYIFRQDYDPAPVQQEVSLFLRSLDAAPASGQGFIDRVAAPLGDRERGRSYIEPKKPIESLIVASDAMAPRDGRDPRREADEPSRILACVRLSGRGFPRRSDDPSALSGTPRAVAGNFQALESRSCCCRWFMSVQVRGAVAFGAKRSGSEYSAEDFRLLATLTDQLALSLENGRLYEESIQAYRPRRGQPIGN